MAEAASALPDMPLRRALGRGPLRRRRRSRPRGTPSHHPLPWHPPCRRAKSVEPIEIHTTPRALRGHSLWMARAYPRGYTGVSWEISQRGIGRGTVERRGRVGTAGGGRPRARGGSTSRMENDRNRRHLEPSMEVRQVSLAGSVLRISLGRSASVAFLYGWGCGLTRRQRSVARALEGRRGRGGGDFGLRECANWRTGS
jgi:hypothetical protein